MSINIGEIIKLLGKEKGLKAKAIASFVNVSESSLYKIYNRQSIDMEKMIKFSKLFNKNLFLYYLNEEPLKSMFSKDIVLFQNQIADLEKDLNLKNGKIEDLLEIIANQKKLISFYEESQAKSKRGSKG